MKIVFFGTPEFAKTILHGLVKHGFDVKASVTQPDKPQGRSRVIRKSPVKIYSEHNEITVLQPDNLKDEKFHEVIAGIKSDIIIAAAYGKLIPKKILDIPEFGALNVHASLLPKYRGASPIQAAILAGDELTGVTIMLMNEKMDEGDIIVSESLRIGYEDNTAMLTEKLAVLGTKLLVGTINKWSSGKIKAQRQNELEASYCGEIRKEDGEINWRQEADQILRQLRALEPWPGIYTWLGDEGEKKRLKILDAKVLDDKSKSFEPGRLMEYLGGVAIGTKKGMLVPLSIQIEGKKPMLPQDFLRGYARCIGKIIG